MIPLTTVDPQSEHVAYFRELCAAGQQNAVQLWRALHARGFVGSAGTIRRYVGNWRTSPGRRGRAAHRASPSQSAPLAIPSPRQVCWWLLKDVTELTPDQAAFTRRLLADYPGLSLARDLVLEFGRVLRERHQAAFVQWLTEQPRPASFRSCVTSLLGLNAIDSR